MKHVSEEWRLQQADTVLGRLILGSWLLNCGDWRTLIYSTLFTSLMSVAW